MPEPKLRLTVKRNLWDAMAEEISVSFADSYLSEATQTASTLLPHTLTAHGRLKQNVTAMRVLRDHGLKLVEPLPFGHPNRPDASRARAA